ncbi:MAG: hypothetical protein CSA95_07475 [Bacteroidetes bacterium]|nr:MAG: hypothetical protein CSA95_07475 [Bacteroidota bacterium]PIE87673.1 MAG: hypothetical protein CSA04_05800 [Bacteroidota bacterium]
MKRVLISLIALLLATLSAVSQNRADEILAQFYQRITDETSLTVAFEYRFEEGQQPAHKRHHGTLKMKGDKFRFEMAGQVFICDGVSLWTYIPEVEEVQLNTLEESEDAFLPTTIFSSYRENFTATYNRTYRVGPKAIHVIDLTPKEKEMPFSSAQLEIDESTMEPIQITLFSTQGNVHYIINKFLTGKINDVSIFTFDPSKHPDVELIDMR